MGRYVDEARPDQIGDEYVMANKPNPAFLANKTLDEDAVRKEIEKHCPLGKK